MNQNKYKSEVLRKHHQAKAKTKEARRDQAAERWLRIEDAMAAMGLKGHGSKKGLADKLGITAASIGGWKSGRYLPDMEKMQSIAELSGYSLEWLWTGKGPKRPSENLSPEAERILDALPNLSDERLEIILKIVESE